MRIAGWLMLVDEVAHGEGSAGRVRLSRGAVEVEGGRIVEVVEGDEESDCELGGPGCVVMPGLIDAHVHLPQFGIVGAHGMGLLDWLTRVTFPAESAWADAEVARAQARSAIGRMLACGTTGFAAYATVHGEGARAALEVASDMGVRAHVGQVLMDRGAPAALCRPAGQLIDESAALLDAYPPGGRVCAAVTPRFAPTCSENLLNAAGELAAKHGALIQTHLAETPAECGRVRELFGGSGYAQVYDDAGLLSDRAVLGHGIYLDDDERALLASRGATIAHCPLANSFLMSGRFDRGRAIRAGVRVALGSDLGAGYEPSMVRVARAVVETAGALAIDASARRVDRAPLPSASEAWYAVTRGNAEALGWADGGRLSPGGVADLVVVEPTIDLPRLAGGGSVPDALSALLFGWDDRWVRATLVRGRPPEHARRVVPCRSRGAGAHPGSSRRRQLEGGVGL
ncbi:MAG: amidohydrolase family protein, partial [Phycisphaeraceae bacterium]